MDERAYVRAGALALVVGGIVAAVGNLLHPRYPNMEDVQVYGKVAHSGAWRPADALVLVAIVLTIAGMTALAVALQASQWGVLASYGRVAALVGGAVALAATSLDMYAMKEAAQNFAGANANDRVSAFWATNAIDKLGVGMFNVWTVVFLGLAPLLLGLAMLRSGRLPSWLGWVGAVGGAVCAVVGLVGLFRTDQGALNGPFLVGSLLVTVWFIAAGFLLWREPVAAA